MSRALKILVQKYSLIWPEVEWIYRVLSYKLGGEKKRGKLSAWSSQSVRKNADQAQCLPGGGRVPGERTEPVVMTWGGAAACCVSSYFLVGWRNVVAAALPELPPPPP